MTIDRRNVRALVRAIAYDVRGSRLGRVAQVFLDDRTDEPAWVAVDVTRTRGMRLLPLAGAGMKGRHLVIRAERSTVRSAPRIDLGDGQLSSQDESRLLEHYGLAAATAGEMTGPGEQRPMSPWPDDTERETAWNRPAEGSAPDETHQDTQRYTDDGSHNLEHGTGDRRVPDQPLRATPVDQRDTAPSPSTEAPTPAPPAAATPTAPQPVAAPVPPAQRSGSPEPRPDAEPSGSRA
jgi:hypothetical protein